MTGLQLQNWLDSHGIDVKVADIPYVEAKLKALSEIYNDKHITHSLMTRYMQLYAKGKIRSPTKYLITYLKQLVSSHYYSNKSRTKELRADYGYLIDNIDGLPKAKPLDSNGLLWLINEYTKKYYGIVVIADTYRDFYRSQVERGIKLSDYQTIVKRILHILKNLDTQVALFYDDAEVKAREINHAIYQGLKGLSNGG